MPRIVSVWLPRWPILRFIAAQQRSPSPHEPVDPERPFILAVDASGGPRIAALNAAAEALGLMRGDQVADARAKAGVLAGASRRSRGRPCRPAAPGAVGNALHARRLALGRRQRRGRSFSRCHRRRPSVRRRGELLADLAAAARALRPAGTAGGCRYGRSGLGPVALPSFPGCRPAFRAGSGGPRPFADRGAAPCRRYAHDAAAARLQARRRACSTSRAHPLPRAFRAELLQRLDQALGRAPEPLAFIAPPPAYHSLRQLLEPIMTQEAIVTVATRLMQDLVPALERDGVGARSLRLALYRIDGEVSDRRYRPHGADTQPRACRAPHRSQARAHRRDDRCRLRFRGGEPHRHRRRAHGAEADRACCHLRCTTRRTATRRSSTASGSGSARTACGNSSRWQAICPKGPRLHAPPAGKLPVWPAPDRGAAASHSAAAACRAGRGRSPRA